MFTKSTVSTARTLTAWVDRANVSLLPVARSPLAEMCRLCQPIHRTQYRSSMEAIDDVAQIAAIPMEHSVSPHEVEMTQEVEVIVETLRRMFEYTRNVVLPFIGEAVGYADAAVQKQRDFTFDIRQVSFSNALASPVITDLTSKYHDASIEVPIDGLGRSLPQRTAAELIELIKTGSEMVDSIIVDVLSKHPEDFIVQIYDMYFRNAYQPVIVDNDINIPTTAFIGRQQVGGKATFMTPMVAYADVPLIGFLLSYGIFDRPFEGLDATLDEWEIFAGRIRNALGRVITNLQDDVKHVIEDGVLVARMPVSRGMHRDPSQGIAYVYADVYRRFREKGGSPEMLTGMFIGERRDTVDAILAHGDSYLSSAEAYDRTIDQQMESERWKTIRMCLRAGIAKAMENLPADNLPSDYDRAAARERVEAVSEGISSEVYLNNVYAAARTIACKAVFIFIDAEEVLKHIDREMSDDPDMNPMTAAYYAAVHVVSDYLVNQMEVVN